ncbi:MAG: efflux RND transporter permease subunit [Hyphomicrobiales bacterium]
MNHRWFNVSAWSIHNPWPAAILFVALVFLGLWSFQKMAVTRYPDVDVPVVLLTVERPGTPAATLEDLVAKPLERELRAIPQAKHVLTMLSEGFVAITVEFRVDKRSSTALADVEGVFEKLKGELPPDLKNPKIELIEVTGPAGLTYAVKSAKLTPEELTGFVRTKVLPVLDKLPAVSDVVLSGGANKQVSVALDPRKVAENGIMLGDIAKAVAAVAAKPVPDADGDPEKIAAAIGALEVTTKTGQPMKLADIATIDTGDADSTSFAMVDGKPVIAVSVYQARGASDVEVADEVSTRIAEIARANPDVTFDLVDSSAPYTLGNFHSAMHTLWEGAILTVLVVLLFLRNVRATIIAAIALPLSIIPAFWAMSLLGFSLNLVTLLGITIVTGILVDDAIVEIENIVRHMRMGKSPLVASLEAADEIGLTIIAISLTIVAVFVPVSFMSGLAGRFFTQFGLTVSVAVMFSLLVARLITPVLTAYFLHPSDAGNGEEEKPGAIMRGYLGLLRRALDYRYLTVLLGLLIFGGSIYATRYLPSGLLPAEDTSRILMSVQVDDFTSIYDTENLAKKVTEIVQRQPEVKAVAARGSMSGDPRVANMVIHLKPRADRTRSQKQVAAAIAADLEKEQGLHYWFVNEMSGIRDLSLAIVGEDSAAVADAARKLEEQAKSVKQIRNVIATAAPEMPSLQVKLKPEEIAANGVSRDSIFDALRIATIGDTDTAVPRGDPSGETIKVRLSVDAGGAEQAAQFDDRLLQALFVPTKSGERLSIDKLAAVDVVTGPISLARRNGLRVVSLEADLAPGGSLGDAIEAIKALPAAKTLPASVKIEEAGDAETMNETFHSFGIAMGLGIAAMLTILILLFRSVLQPVTILASLPLSIAGAIIALLLFSKALDMPVIIGLLMLIGIVTKNAIMLVDFAMAGMRRGLNRGAALIDAGQKRARPIIMTTIAMVAGMLPSALGLGEGGEFRSPMAIAVIGGLVLSTLLSLLFVPAMFSIMDDLGRLFTRRKAQPA